MATTPTTTSTTSSTASARTADPANLRAARNGDRSVASVVFLFALWFALAFSVLCLAVLLADSFLDGITRLDAELFGNYTSQIRPETAGARAAILGSAWVIGATALLAIPLGVAAGVYLEEFADPRTWYNRLVEVNLTNLAAVPAIVYGMLTAGLVLTIDLPRRVVLSGAIALALLILPVIIIATREAVRAVPREIREGSLALGATPLQTVWRQTLPAAVPGIATGAILALSRALGEAAPLLLLGGAVTLTYDPNGLLSGFTTLPIQIFSWAQQPQDDFHHAASAAIIVMLVLLLAMNAVAILIRNRYQKRW
jgi:phosphate ABC transporter permease subunit PstA